jgi:hypothetical protein
VLISFAWIFFRANSAGDAFYIIKGIFTGYGSFYQSLLNIKYELSYKMIGLNTASLFLCFAGIFIMLYYNLSAADSLVFKIIKRLPRAVRYAGLIIIALIIFLFGNFSTEQFIYFSF